MRAISVAAAPLAALALLLLGPAFLPGEGLSAVAGAEAEAAPLPVAVPDAAAQAAARKLVLDIYKTDLAAAKLPEDKIALAKKLLQAAAGTKNDPAGQFTLISLARDLAVAARDADLSLAAVGQMATAFDIDFVGTKIDTLTKVLAEARKVRDTAQIAKLTTQLADLKDAKANYEKVMEALGVLEKTPTDPAANLTVGKFQCFGVGDWDKGLPMLVLGSDAGLKGLAQKELARPTETFKLLEIADAWWDISQKQTGTMQSTVQKHAAVWYDKALFGLTGLAKTKAEKRIAEAAGAVGGPITVQRAAYGLPNSTATDITKKLAAAVTDIGLVVRSDTSLIGKADILTTSPMLLSIEYTSQGKLTTVTAKHGEILVLPNPVKTQRKGMVLVKALWGAGCTWADVTPVFQKALTARQTSVAVSNAAMGIDPSSGTAKVCVVIFSTDGKLSWTSVGEGGKIPLPPALQAAP